MNTSRKTIIKKTIALVVPLSTSRLFNMLALFIGTLFIARINHTVLAASALITATQSCLVIIGISLLFSVGVMVGNAYGGKRHEEIGTVVQQGLLMAILVAIPLVVILFFIKPVLLALGQNHALVAIAVQYFNWYMPGVPAFCLMIVLQQFILSVERQLFVFVMSFVGLLLAVFFAYGLVYGRLGMPKMGVPGLGLAYTIQSWIAFLIYLAYTYYQKAFNPYKIFRVRLKNKFHFLRKLFHIGWPIFLQRGNDLFSFFVITIMIGWIGETALAAQQIVIQYFLLLVVPIFAVAQASAILVSQSHGAKAFVDLKRYGNSTLFLGLLFSSAVVIAFVLFPTELITLYLHKKTIVHSPTVDIARIILILTGFRLAFDAIVEIKIGSLRGLYDTKYPMVLSFMLTWIVGIPLAYLSGFTMHWGLIGITSAGVLTTLVSAAILWRRWLVMSERVARCS